MCPLSAFQALAQISKGFLFSAMLNIDDRLIKDVSPRIGANALSVLLAIAIHLNQTTNRCFPSHFRLMELTGLGRDAVYAALSRLQKEGLLKSEQNIDSKKKTFSRRVFRVSTRFIQVFVCAEDIEPLPEIPDTVQPDTVHPDTANQETKQINKSEQINQIEQINKGEQITPQAASITLHTPDQIGYTFVELVEQISLEEKTALDKTGSAGPVENKENPALQNAGHFEASVPPNPPPTKKARKPKPNPDNTAAVCAELKTEKDVDFFHAIHATWGEWIDYKRREKKGTYKTAKTEAATITALARTVNYDPVAGRAAIEHSIAHTYQGIYPPKDGAPAKQAAERYSLEDCPQAKTPEEMRGEISRFYNANKSRFDELQRIAETNYGPDRLRSIVTDFCGNRISKSRQGETFGQHHAALGAWLKRQKEFDAKNEAPKHAGPQGRQLFSAAPVNYSLD